MADKEERQSAIQKVVEIGNAKTQSDLCSSLEALGFSVDQSTLSRDLSELGVRKSGGRYVMPEADPQDEAMQIDYSSAVKKFTACGPHMIVVSTGVGQAAPIAVAIDNRGEPALAGTIAGDDIIFIATKNRRAQAVILRRLKQWFGDKYEQ